jgi:MFS superfamily sulfate permease-like transporter
MWLFLVFTRWYTSCFVVVVVVAVAFDVAVAVAVAVVVTVVACLLVLYSMKQFENLPLQQSSHARMQFGILLLQQGTNRAPRSCSLVSCHCK